MSGEPKTLTPGELLAIAHEHDWSAHFHDDGYVEIESLGGDYLAYEGGLLDALCAATSKVLGVPVVARDEAAGLRAAIKEYVEAVDAYYGGGQIGSAAAWGHLMDKRDALRRLAGEENEK